MLDHLDGSRAVCVLCAVKVPIYEWLLRFSISLAYRKVRFPCVLNKIRFSLCVGEYVMVALVESDRFGEDRPSV